MPLQVTAGAPACWYCSTRFSFAGVMQHHSKCHVRRQQSRLGAELFCGREHITQQVTHWTRINLPVLDCGISAAHWTTVVGFLLGLNANACLQGLGWDCRDQLLSSHWNKAPSYSRSHCELTASSGFKWKDQPKRVSLYCHYTPTSCCWHL